MNDQILNALNRKGVVPTAVGLAAFLGGGALGYILGKRRERKETGEQVRFALEVAKKGELRPVQIDLEENETTFESVTVIPQSEEIYVPPIRVVREIHDEIIWDWETEKSTRTHDEAYVIHRDEFFNDEMGYTQSTVTYYAGDDIMTDELDTPIYGHTAMVGELKFGHGSGDEDVVYIRNELLEHEYEVVQVHNRYEVVVLGHEIDEQYKNEDLHHSAVPKFRLKE